MLSVNQKAAQIKLTEMWKAVNDPLYPIKMKKWDNQGEGMETRSGTPGDLTESGGSVRAKKSFTIDAAREDKDSQIIGNRQKGNQSTLQKVSYLDSLKVVG
jgi:hypothetical protein